VSLDAALAPELASLEAAGLRRTLRAGGPGPRVTEGGRELVLLGSNNYLGLANHPALARAARAAVRRWGTGAGGSRLTTGNLPEHEALEAELAAWQGAEAALLFPTGYQAALGTLPALAGPDDLILSDALNHACLIDGCRLSRATVRVYRHADAEHAAELLSDRDRFRRALIVTDGVFSMDGDLAPLPALAALGRTHDAWLVVDDAHGGGVLGPTGAGTAEHVGAEVTIRIGTLSKALGSEGGYVAGSRTLITWLLNRARSFVFTTAPAPATVAAARAALALVRGEPQRRAALAARAMVLRERLRAAGVPMPAGETPIVPVVFGAPEAALTAAAHLEAAGFRVPAIRPPTVPAGTARLRLSVMASHEPADLERAATAVAEAWHAR